MAKKPSRDMLTTGLVGSYLLASAWGLMLLGTLVLLMGGMNSLDTQLGMTFGAFAVIAGLLWLGGAICEAIGWMGLGRLYPGLPGGIGWLEASLPVLTLVLFVVMVSLLDFVEAGAHFMAILQITHFLTAGLWMATHGPRRVTLPAAIGYGLALAGGCTLYALAIARSNPEVMGLVLLVIFLAGGTVAHLGTGVVFAKNRALADSVNTF